MLSAMLMLSIADHAIMLSFTAGLPNLFSVAGHFHMGKFIADHKRFCDVKIRYRDIPNPLILISFMR